MRVYFSRRSGALFEDKKYKKAGTINGCEQLWVKLKLQMMPCLSVEHLKCLGNYKIIQIEFSRPHHLCCGDRNIYFSWQGGIHQCDFLKKLTDIWQSELPHVSPVSTPCPGGIKPLLHLLLLLLIQHCFTPRWPFVCAWQVPMVTSLAKWFGCLI